MWGLCSSSILPQAADQVELKAVIEEQMTGAQDNKGGDEGEEEGSSEDAEEVGGSSGETTPGGVVG